jgi:hypothetical protein
MSISLVLIQCPDIYWVFCSAFLFMGYTLSFKPVSIGNNYTGDIVFAGFFVKKLLI